MSLWSSWPLQLGSVRNSLFAMRFASLLLAAFASTATAASSRCFPDNFMFGSATASYQVEGAVKEGGRTSSIWDDYCRQAEGKKCANVAVDFYHRYKEDLKLMVETGLQSFRFSISWSRVMNWDKTTKRMKVNLEGVQFYHDLIDEIRANNLEPLLTLYHWDLPSELENELSPAGWLNAEIQDHFLEYSDLIFNEYGKKVDIWSTINEPVSVAGYGYSLGMLAPGHTGSETESYVVSTNLLLAHAKAVDRFRELKKKKVVGKKGRIGIVTNSAYYYPLDPQNPKDIEAAERAVQFEMGWFLEPLISGDYPEVMRETLGDRLPKFTKEESKLLKGSYDVFMINHYGSNAVTDCDSPTSTITCESLAAGWIRDRHVDATHLLPGSFQGKIDRSGNPYCQNYTGYPPGYLALIKWVSSKNPDADILLTENGWCGNEDVENYDQLKFYQAFVEQVYTAIHYENLPIIGYTAWSFLDNYEWGSYVPRFGLYYVNFTEQSGSPDFYEPKPTDLERIPRPAAKWFKKIASSRCLDDGTVADSTPAAKVEAKPLILAEVKTSSKTNYLSIGVAGVLAVGVAMAAVVAKRRHGYERMPLLSKA